MPSFGRQHKHRDSEPTSPLPRRWINDVELAGYLGVSANIDGSCDENV